MNNDFAKMAHEFVSHVRETMRTAKTEEDLKMGVEKFLMPILMEMGIKPHYERLSNEAKSIYKGRPDAVHGKVIVEYEAPDSFTSQRTISHAFKEQLIPYLKAEIQVNDTKEKYIGVGFDGNKIFFVNYKIKESDKLTDSDFLCSEIFNFDFESARTFLTYLHSLGRLPLNAENLIELFGTKSKVAPQVVSALYDALKNWNNARVNVFYTEWKRLFGIVYGEKLSIGASGKNILAEIYNVDSDADFQELLFCVHTYFAILMKLIAIELISFDSVSFTSSVSDKLTHASKSDLFQQLKDIEEGRNFAQLGITNFLEGNFFSWYLDAFSPRMEDAIREITRQLSNFEAATSTIAPEITKDILKHLYQYLVPQKVRHNLGEYYTPDWLAELMVNESGYTGDSLEKVLDPSCGSGTFIVSIINKAKQRAEIDNISPMELAKRIIHHIWGFDLNPLAVIAAKTNYLFALGDLLKYLNNFEIPIYLADSVLWPENGGQLELAPVGNSVAIKTSIKTFYVPEIWIKGKGFMFQQAAPLLDEMIKNNYTTKEAVDRLTAEGLVFGPHENVVKYFYDTLIELEKEGKNGIWAKFLKNIFAPIAAGKFDFIIGNPPWIRWGYLSEEYKKATFDLWKKYGLFSLKGHAAMLGGGEKDFSMLFTYSVIDNYLKDNGKLTFLITQEIFKSKGAGEGFRSFYYNKGEKRINLKVTKAHDFISFQPFEGATNKTAAITIEKGKENIYPVPYYVWTRKENAESPKPNFSLKECLKLLKKEKYKAFPIDNNTGSWQTIIKSKTLIQIKGNNFYTARLGARIEPYGIFLIEVISILSDNNLLIRNLATKGKRIIKQVEVVIEPDLVFPAVRGGDIKRWKAIPSNTIIMTQNPQISSPYPEQEMKKKWPRTYNYFTQHKDVLLTRGSKSVRTFAERTAFYAMFGIGKYTVANYKVVWNRMGNDIKAAVITQIRTKYGYRTIIPTDTTSLIALDNEPEAHYLCAIINSKLVRDFIKSYSSAGRGLGAPSVMKYLGIDQFDSKNQIHKQLSDLSLKLHENENVDLMDNLEAELNILVKQLFEEKNIK